MSDYEKILRQGIAATSLEMKHQKLCEALDRLEKQGEWQPIETAPRDETLFLCRDKEKPHVTFEAALFQEHESYEIPEEYDVLQNMTTDEPIADDWFAYEWQSLPQPPQED